MTEIELPPECTLRAIRSLHERIAQAFRSADGVTIDCGGLFQIDFAGVQLLVAAIATARARGLELRLVAPPALLSDAFARAGFDGLPATLQTRPS